MYDAFVKDPDYTPFTAVPNQIPLTENVKRVPACGPDKAKGDGAATTVPANMKPVAKKWEDWRTHQPFITEKEEDSVDPVLMNRFTWYNAHFFRTPYPGDSTIYTPDQVPGAGKDVKDEDDIDVMLGKDDDDDDDAGFSGSVPRMCLMARTSPESNLSTRSSSVFWRSGDVMPELFSLTSATVAREGTGKYRRRPKRGRRRQAATARACWNLPSWRK